MQSNQDTSWKHTLLLNFPNAILDKQNSFKPPHMELVTQASHTDVSKPQLINRHKTVCIACTQIREQSNDIRVNISYFLFSRWSPCGNNVLSLCFSLQSPMTNSLPRHVSLLMNFHLDSFLSGITELLCAHYIKCSSFCMPRVVM